MGLGLLFSGQGGQHAQMLPWLDPGALVDRVNQTLGVADWRCALQDPSWGARNRNAQVLLTGLALAAWAQLSPWLPAPLALAGYSVGELAAFSAAGVFCAEKAIDLAAQRANVMDRCATSGEQGLLAVTGLTGVAIDSLCADAGVELAIRVAADAAVLGGAKLALADAEARAVAQGAKCTLLNVAVASHTSVMRPAAQAFAQTLRGAALSPPKLALFSNAAADRITSTEHAAAALAQQIAQTVQWAACLDAVHDRRPSCVVEIGPGSALATMWNRRFPDVPARCVDEFRSMSAVRAWVLRHV